MTDKAPMQKQAEKCVNEFVERADGNLQEARKLWFAERDALPFGYKYKAYVHAMNYAFECLLRSP